METGRRETGEADGKQNKEISSCRRFDETGSEKDEPPFCDADMNLSLQEVHLATEVDSEGVNSV